MTTTEQRHGSVAPVSAPCSTLLTGDLLFNISDKLNDEPPSDIVRCLVSLYR